MATKTTPKKAQTTTKRNTKPMTKNAKNSKRKKKKKSLIPVFVTCGVFLTLVLATSAAYLVGRAKFDERFIPNTFINDIDVSGKTLAATKQALSDKNSPTSLNVTKHDGSKVEIKLSDFDYHDNSDEQIEKIFKNVNQGSWFLGYTKDSIYTYETSVTYDSDKLKKLLSDSDWGEVKNKDAKLKLTDSGYEIEESVQGDKMDYSILEDYIIQNIDNNKFDITANDSGCYIPPKVTTNSLKDKCDKLNQIFKMKIGINFDYTTENLTGKKLMGMINVDDDYNINADYNKVMEYVEKLAEKYDTFDTPRKFHATIQGDITVPTSDDAKYGWWLDQEKTCNQLIELLEQGESVEKVDPIYYDAGGYVFTGRKEARSKDDDIGDTYIELDLSNQKFWYYEKGKLKKECSIVSGQTTSEARTTLPGVYKVWNKATNYRMKDTNKDGDEWDTTCNYWTRVAIVGIGMHDSTWRGAFGGTIYKYNGSHGCINMPLEYAKFVHDNVPMDTPVVMYY